MLCEFVLLLVVRTAHTWISLCQWLPGGYLPLYEHIYIYIYRYHQFEVVCTVYHNFILYSLVEKQNIVFKSKCRCPQGSRQDKERIILSIPYCISVTCWLCKMICCTCVVSHVADFTRYYTECWFPISFTSVPDTSPHSWQSGRKSRKREMTQAIRSRLQGGKVSAKHA